jgi:hypothetical protein
MTELTLLDWAFMALLLLLVIGLWWWALDLLRGGDRTRNRESQCPPHEWAPYYVDVSTGGFKFVGLRCGKCKRTPDGLSKGESWTGSFGGWPP